MCDFVGLLKYQEEQLKRINVLETELKALKAVKTDVKRLNELEGMLELQTERSLQRNQSDDSAALALDVVKGELAEVAKKVDDPAIRLLLQRKGDRIQKVSDYLRGNSE